MKIIVEKKLNIFFLQIAIIKNNIAIRIAGKVSRYIDASMNRATPSWYRTQTFISFYFTLVSLTWLGRILRAAVTWQDRGGVSPDDSQRHRTADPDVRSRWRHLAAQRVTNDAGVRAAGRRSADRDDVDGVRGRDDADGVRGRDDVDGVFRRTQVVGDHQLVTTTFVTALHVPRRMFKNKIYNFRTSSSRSVLRCYKRAKLKKL